MKGNAVSIRSRSLSAVVICTYFCILPAPAQQYASIHAAAEAGDVQAITTMVDQGQDINLRDSRGYTPLLAAAAGGHVEAVELVLNKGGDINAVDNAGNTALHIATAYGHAGVCRLLLQKGASRDVRNYAGLTALEIARNAQRPELISLLEPLGPQESAGEAGPQDPNQVWRAAALKVLADPNGLAASLAKYKDIYDAATALANSARQELMAWMQAGPTQATRLQRALQTQIGGELDFVRRTAVAEGANRTAADANQLMAVWEQRLKVVSERIREQRRQELAQMRGRPMARPGTVQTLPLPALLPPVPAGPNVPRSDSYFAPARVRADGERLAQTWASPSLDIRQLAADVNDLWMRDLGYLRTVATGEKASARTIAAIDAMIALRAQRYQAVLQAGQQVVQPEQPTGQGGWRRQYP